MTALHPQVLCIFGTRPEAIKFAPVVRALADDAHFTPVVCTTSQHRSMLDQVLSAFDLKQDIDLNLMQPQQDLVDVTTRVLLSLRAVLDDFKPDWVLVQGDTT